MVMKPFKKAHSEAAPDGEHPLDSGKGLGNVGFIFLKYNIGRFGALVFISRSASKKARLVVY